MKKISFFALTFALIASSFSVVSAEEIGDVKTATVNITGGDLSVTADSNIEFGDIQLTGGAQSIASITAPALTVLDSQGDNFGWAVALTIDPLTNLNGDSLANHSYDFNPGSSAISGTGVTAGNAATGITPDSPFTVLTGTDVSVTGTIDFNDDFLTLHFGSGARTGSYTGNATFSIIASS